MRKSDLPAAVGPVIEAMESRRLLSADAPTFLAFANNTQNFSDTRRAVNYVDVTDIAARDASADPVLGGDPTFSIFSFEFASFVGGENFEEISSLAVNPATGDTYTLSFDSGTPGNVDGSGDTEGDYDLYVNRAGAAHADFVANDRPKGIMYVPTVTHDGLNYQASFGSRPTGPTGLPSVTASDIGIPAGRSNADADPSNDIIWIDNVREKIGEVARTQGGDFFDPSLAFVDANTLVLLENASTTADFGLPSDDFSVRKLERISLSPGQAMANSTNTLGGFNGQATQSWESVALAGDLELDGGVITDPNDENAGLQNISEPFGLEYVEEDGTAGVWIGEDDGAGDQFAFFELDLDAETIAPGELRVGESPFGNDFRLDDDPTIDSAANDGNADWFDLDEEGNLIISESGFFETPQTEPKIITRDVLDYGAADTDDSGQGEVIVGGFATSAPLSPTVDDDTAITDGRFGTYERGGDYAYYFDVDAFDGGNNPNVDADLYVLDVDSGELVYQEQNAISAFFGSAQTILTFTLGDYFAQDGLVTADDIDAQAQAIRANLSPAAADGFDLNGDGVLDFADRRFLVEGVLGTFFGDANLDGRVTIADFAQLRAGFGSAGGFASGDFNGDGTVSIADFALLRSNFGQSNA